MNQTNIVLSDFFGDQKTVWLSEEAERGGPTYVPYEGGAEIRVLESMTSNEPSQVRTAAHEIGHFLTAPESRLHLLDYGYANTTESWSVKMWNLEFDVLAIQASILRGVRRHKQVDNLINDMPMFLRRSGQSWLEATGLKQKISESYSTWEHRIIADHVKEEIERRQSVLPNYTGLVDKFHRRCGLIKHQHVKAA